jgi:hypothetical protein
MSQASPLRSNLDVKTLVIGLAARGACYCNPLMISSTRSGVTLS